MPTKARKVLIPINHEAFALHQLCLYYALEKQGGWKPVLLSTMGQRFLEICMDRGLLAPDSLIYPPGDSGFAGAAHAKSNASESSQNTISETGQGTIKDRVKRVLKSRLPKKLKLLLINLRAFLFTKPDWFTIPELIKTKKKQINYLCDLINKEDIQVIILTETCPVYDAPLYAAAARKTGAKLVTTTMSRDNSDSYAEIYKTDPVLTARSIKNVLVGLLFPKWVYAYGEKHILRAAVPEIIAQEILGISSPKPWDAIGSLEDKVLVEYDIEKTFYEKYGVREDRISVTGSGRQDILSSFLSQSEQTKRKVCGELGFDCSKEIILCALPQTHWNCGRPEAEYQSHQEMIAAWIDALMAQSKFNVIVTLHPSMPVDKFNYIENDRLKISRRSSFELIAICSMFVTCVSTVLPLAISAGKPAINYDVYRYSRTMYWLRFSEAEGVITVFNRNDFAEAILKFSTNKEYLAEMTRRQERGAKQWGILDGRAAERIVSEMDKLVDSGSQ